jgi:Fe-S oxidoreductase
MNTCAMCPKMCRFACPVARAKTSDAVHPTGLASAAIGAKRGTLPWSVAGEVVYECTMCGACKTPCALDVDVPAWLRPARAEAVALGAAPAAVTEIAQRAEETGSPYGVRFTAPSGEGDVAYVPSCTTVARTPEVMVAVLAVLESAGVRARVVHPGCCGGALDDLGCTDLASRLHARMSDAIGDASAVVTDGPLCARWLDAIPFAIYADGLIAEGRLTPRRGVERAAYHDPCVLGRHLGRYDEPRRVLAAIFGELVELPYTRERARCSGGGAGLPATDPDASAAIAAERVAEIREAGADVVVSACPRCKVQLRDAGVRDIAEVLAEAL